MSTRDRRSQRIRDQFRAHANPRSGQAVLPRSLQEQLKRIYGGENGVQLPPDPVARDLARIARRRR
jgi:hypothetical protein